jgi:hypothetical protein
VNLQNFIEAKEKILAEQPDILDLSESRLRNSRLKPRNFHPDDLPEVSYRCHLAEFWLDAMKLSRDLKPNTLISQGVRHSLEVLLKSNFAKLWVIPEDVYPVYMQLAKRNPFQLTVTYRSYPLANIPQGDFLLFCHPSKPRNEPLSMGERATLFQWLAHDKKRRIVIDGVYNYFDMDELTQSLWDTGQAIFLHSLSKSFISEKMMGVCMVPSEDISLYTPTFRALTWEDDKENFRKAEFLLRKERFACMTYGSQILTSRLNMQRELHRDFQINFYISDQQVSYLQVVPYSWEELLDKGILAIPYSVFGGQLTNLSVISSLRYI